MKKKKKCKHNLLKVKGNKLTLKQEMFCKLYASSEEFFGNGVKSYLASHPDSSYESAKADAYKYLTNTYICERINELLEIDGLNDQFVDKQLKYLLTQHGDNTAKIKAITEYNKLKNRIIENVNVKVSPAILIDLTKKYDSAKNGVKS